MLKVLTVLAVSINIALTLQNICIGKHYIPLNNHSSTILKRNISTLIQMGFGDTPIEQTIENNGQTIIIKNVYKQKLPRMLGGPYGKTQYRFDFMYFHWLNESTLASQYRNNSNEQFPAELHLLFIDMRYDSFDVAVTKNFGVTVWAFKYKVIENGFNVMNNIFEAFESIRQPNSKTTVEYFHTFKTPLNIMYSTLNDFYVYQGKSVFGSSRQCSGDVIWMEFPNHLELLPNQVKHFEQLLSFDNKPLMSKSIATEVANGPIYQDIDHYLYADLGCSAIPFEYFTASNDANGLEIFYRKIIFLIILLENLMRFVY